MEPKVAEPKAVGPKAAGPKVAAVDVTTLQARVYNSLSLALLRGRFVPGEIVSLRGLAEMVGTSAMPVREAVGRLIAEGVLTQSADRVIRVAPASHAAYEELVRVRILIEGYAAECTARRASEELLSSLRHFNDQMNERASKLDVEAALAANYSFHFTIYEAANFPQLLGIITSLWLRSGPMIAIAQQDALEARAMFLTGVKAHNRIIDALANRDAVVAKRNVGVDLRAASIWMRQQYSKKLLLLEKGRPGPAARLSTMPSD